MIKIILVTAIVEIGFTGCVGTLTANNDIRTNPSSSVQNAKGTLHNNLPIKEK